MTRQGLGTSSEEELQAIAGPDNGDQNGSCFWTSTTFGLTNSQDITKGIDLQCIALLLTIETSFKSIRNHVDCDLISPPPGDDDVCMTSRRMDKSKMHWPDCGLILPQYTLDGPSAFADVSPNTSQQPNVIIGVHEDFDVHQIT